VHFKEEKHKEKDIERKKKKNYAGKFFPCAEQGKNNP
jgi:hypothetical protein